MNTSPDVLVKQFLDGELDAADEAEALRQIAADPKARSLLRAEGQVFRMVSEARRATPAVPPDFTDRVMLAVEAAEAEKVAQSDPAWWQGLWTWFIEPRPITIRPAIALPVLALLVALPLLLSEPAPAPSESEGVPVATAQQEVGDDEGPVLVRFMFVDDEASSVAVAGDFNYWEPESLERQQVDGRTVWSGLMAVPQGEHRYMFVRDGEEWVSDPFAPQARDDGFGEPNAILSL